ncbi:hypothetical protein B0O80DRAFT_452051 [Mortierella sp. GBAus27b]|nr:hypothetical protein B0O80DRAFT_452051 [Mortierella sp. GBAus27b]
MNAQFFSFLGARLCLIVVASTVQQLPKVEIGSADSLAQGWILNILGCPPRLS